MTHDMPTAVKGCYIAPRARTQNNSPLSGEGLSSLSGKGEFLDTSAAYAGGGCQLWQPNSSGWIGPNCMLVPKIAPLKTLPSSFHRGPGRARTHRHVRRWMVPHARLRSAQIGAGNPEGAGRGGSWTPTGRFPFDTVDGQNPFRTSRTNPEVK